MIWPFKRQRCSQCRKYEQVLARITSMDFKAPEDDPLVANAAFDGAAVKFFAAAAVHWFKATGGKNFVTLDMHDPRTGEHYEITMQKAGGKTPAQRLSELKEQLRQFGKSAP